jgi:hypothetical protein
MVASNTSTKVVFAHPSALAIASRYLEPQVGAGAYMDARPVTDEKTKITLGTRMWVDPAAGKTYFTAEFLGGWAVGVTGAAKVIYGG